MAEYYPLLAKAVAALPKSTPEARHAVYERARKALLGQLEKLQPPIPAAALAREKEALDAAAAQLEAELGGKPPPSAPTSRPPRAAAKPAPPPWKTPVPPRGASTRAAPAAPVPDPAPAPAPVLPPARTPAPAAVPTPAAKEPVPPAPRGAAIKEPAPLPRAAPVKEPMPPVPPAAAVKEPAPPPRAAPVKEPPPRAAAKNGIAPAIKPDETPIPAADFTFEPPRETAEARREPRVRLPEPRRPMAPQPDYGDAPISQRLWLVIGVVVLVIAGVAVAAWKLRDRPDQLIAFNKSAGQTIAEKSGTKNVDRVGAATTGASEETTSAPPSATKAAPPQPVQAEISPPAPTSSPAPAAPVAPSTASLKPADANTPLPIAYRAALLVEAPEEQSKVKTFVGTVIWKLQNVSNGPGQPLATAVHADIDVPGDKLKIAVDIQKNTDPSLSASHTMTIVFSVAPGSATGGVKEISLPQLRNEDSASGQPLNGIVVPIMENSFLVGLSRGDPEGPNIDLLKKHQWIDIPIMLDSGRIAKLTFEKNVSGSRAIDDAVASWQSQ